MELDFGNTGGGVTKLDVAVNDHFCRSKPNCLIKYQNLMCVPRNMEGDLHKTDVHRLVVAAGHDDSGPLSFRKTIGCPEKLVAAEAAA